MVQSDRYNESRLAAAIVVVITSSTALAAMPGNVFLPACSSSLPRDSVASVTSVLTVEKRELIERAGRLPMNLIEEIDRGLREVLSL